jgi:hypothetical protein
MVDQIPSRGPQYHSKFRRPKPGGTESTVSHSSRSTARQVRFVLLGRVPTDEDFQSKFRELVGVRDGTCLITDFYYELCTACHIVPQSRPDVSDYDRSSWITRANLMLTADRCIGSCLV